MRRNVVEDLLILPRCFMKDIDLLYLMYIRNEYQLAACVALRRLIQFHYET